MPPVPGGKLSLKRPGKKFDSEDVPKHFSAQATRIAIRNMSLNRTIGSLRHVTACCLLLALVALGGCRLCQDCGDIDYPTYGGAWERTIRDRGRVGSVFDPAGLSRQS